MNRNSRLWKTILRIRQTILRIRQWFRRMKMLARLNRLPGQRQLPVVKAPFSLFGKLLLGEKTVYTVSIPGWMGGRPAKVLLMEVLDRNRLNHVTVKVIRLMDEKVWPEFVATVRPEELTAEGYAVELIIETEVQIFFTEQPA